jgi:hypothetical protein
VLKLRKTPADVRIEAAGGKPFFLEKVPRRTYNETA